MAAQASASWWRRAPPTLCCPADGHACMRRLVHVSTLFSDEVSLAGAPAGSLCATSMNTRPHHSCIYMCVSHFTRLCGGARPTQSWAPGEPAPVTGKVLLSEEQAAQQSAQTHTHTQHVYPRLSKGENLMSSHWPFQQDETLTTKEDLQRRTSEHPQTQL